MGVKGEGRDRWSSGVVGEGQRVRWWRCGVSG